MRGQTDADAAAKSGRDASVGSEASFKRAQLRRDDKRRRGRFHGCRGLADGPGTAHQSGDARTRLEVRRG